LRTIRRDTEGKCFGMPYLRRHSSSYGLYSFSLSFLSLVIFLSSLSPLSLSLFLFLREQCLFRTQKEIVCCRVFPLRISCLKSESIGLSHTKTTADERHELEERKEIVISFLSLSISFLSRTLPPSHLSPSIPLFPLSFSPSLSLSTLDSSA
jgi:hypothetical protein